mmetsp:Transcript_5388/g.13899  ORF Transcript_5388/g.13899 Transcript_5388/m.13899 type:complete len:413 (-) Transcript_5388:850-2088(-)
MKFFLGGVRSVKTYFLVDEASEDSEICGAVQSKSPLRLLLVRRAHGIHGAEPKVTLVHAFVDGAGQQVCELGADGVSLQFFRVRGDDFWRHSGFVFTCGCGVAVVLLLESHQVEHCDSPEMRGGGREGQPRHDEGRDHRHGHDPRPSQEAGVQAQALDAQQLVQRVARVPHDARGQISDFEDGCDDRDEEDVQGGPRAKHGGDAFHDLFLVRGQRGRPEDEAGHHPHDRGDQCKGVVNHDHKVLADPRCEREVVEDRRDEGAGLDEGELSHLLVERQEHADDTAEGELERWDNGAGDGAAESEEDRKGDSRLAHVAELLVPDPRHGGEGEVPGALRQTQHPRLRVVVDEHHQMAQDVRKQDADAEAEDAPLGLNGDLDACDGAHVQHEPEAGHHESKDVDVDEGPLPERLQE